MRASVGISLWVVLVDVDDVIVVVRLSKFRQNRDLHKPLCVGFDVVSLVVQIVDHSLDLFIEVGVNSVVAGVVVDVNEVGKVFFTL